jgi:hypothetical protein
MSAVAGLLAVQVVVSALVALVGAVLVRVCCALATGYRPGYLAAWRASFLAWLGVAVAAMLMVQLAGGGGRPLGLEVVVAAVAALYVLATFIYRLTLAHPRTGRIAWSEAFVVSAGHAVLAAGLSAFSVLLRVSAG